MINMKKSETTVTRTEVISTFLGLYANPTYLEVGVSHGNTFLPQRVKRKVAVDPRYMFDYKMADAEDSTSQYHEVTSDDYFGSLYSPDDIFDVVYLDGLHTFEQILRDLNNALEVTHKKSVIIIDDTRPSTYHSSLKTIKLSRKVKEAGNLPDNSWMGDVYKIVQFVDSFAQQLSYATIEDNHGQLVLWRKSRQSVKEMEVEEIAKAPFHSIYTEESHLKRFPLKDIIKQVKQDLFSQ